MSKAEKRLARMKANPKGWRYEEVAGILKRYGFTTSSAGGSHRVFKHPSGIRTGLLESGSGTLLPVYVEEAVAAIERVREAAQDAGSNNAKEADERSR